MISKTITTYLEKVIETKDIHPVVILSDFRTPTSGGLVVPLHPLMLVPDRIEYSIVKNIVEDFARTKYIDEIAVVYLGLVFNPKTESAKTSEPCIVFQLQNKEGIDVIAYDFVEDEGFVVVAPIPKVTKHFDDVKTSTLPFINKTVFKK
jgi:hypothetical protein